MNQKPTRNSRLRRAESSYLMHTIDPFSIRSNQKIHSPLHGSPSRLKQDLLRQKFNSNRSSFPNLSFLSRKKLQIHKLLPFLRRKTPIFSRARRSCLSYPARKLSKAKRSILNKPGMKERTRKVDQKAVLFSELNK